MKAGPRFFAVCEAGLERRGLVGPQDAQVAQREILQVLLGLAEVQVQQEFKRPNVVSAMNPADPQCSAATSNGTWFRK